MGTSRVAALAFCMLWGVIDIAHSTINVVITGGCPTGHSGFVGSVSDGTATAYFESCDSGSLVVANFRDSSSTLILSHSFDKTASADESTFVFNGVVLLPTSVATDFDSQELALYWAAREHELGALFNAVPDALAAMGISTSGYPYGVLIGGVMTFGVESSSGGSGGGTLPCDGKGRGCCGDKGDNCRGCCGKGCDKCSGFCHARCQEHDDCERAGGGGPDAECLLKLGKAGNRLSGCAVGRHSATQCSCEALGLTNGTNC